MQARCTIDACLKLVTARGWCHGHYYRWRKYGDPLKGRVKYTVLAEFIASRTRSEGDCLVWTSMTRGGYGITTWRGKSFTVHRWAYEQAYGAIPEGLLIDHMCHNRACLNTVHLRAVTPKQNQENLRGEARNNSSGYRGVVLHRSRNLWGIRLGSSSNRIYGGYYPLYELHVAAYQIRALRKKHQTHNDLDRV